MKNKHKHKRHIFIMGSCVQSIASIWNTPTMKYIPGYWVCKCGERVTE